MEIVIMTSSRILREAKQPKRAMKAKIWNFAHHRAEKYAQLCGHPQGNKDAASESGTRVFLPAYEQLESVCKICGAGGLAMMSRVD
jgi:hypothetical protein